MPAFANTADTAASAAIPEAPRTLIIACGAVAKELMAVLRASQWTHVDVTCLPAKWHNTPDRIAPAVDAKISAARERYARILVAYGDCGTGGHLDRVLERHNVERLPGAHCYSFFAGGAAFDTLADAEPGTFYLTDYLAANFDRLILDEMGIRKHPELRDMYFGNYTRVLYLAQTHDPALAAAAKAAGEAIKLPVETLYTGLEPVTDAFRTIHIATA